MSKPPFDVEPRGRLLFLFLDTPACEINIFSEKAASQLVSVLSEVRPEDFDAVVIASRKPRSFINGVGLMLAQSVKQPEDVAKLSAPVRQAYDRLSSLGVPTVALVRGACFGCGVELTLRCSHRVASDSIDTRFYMTELADYLFIPCFGATYRMPPRLGLATAADFLLFGPRWSGADAVSAGLVDACEADARFDDDLEGLVREALAAKAPRPVGLSAAEEARSLERTRQRIEAMPPAYQPVYRECLELLTSVARGEVTPEEAEARELMASGRSLMTDVSHHALSFFFVRQTAVQRSRLRIPPVDRYALRLEGLEPIAERLRGRALTGVTLGEGAPRLTLAAPGSGGRDADALVALVALDEGLGALDEGRSEVEVLVHAPRHAEGSLFAEVACRRPEAKARALAVVDLLTRLGYEPVLTAAPEASMAHALLRAYERPLRAYLDGGGRPEDLEATLRSLGFVRRASSLVAARLIDLGERFIASDGAAGVAVPALADALLVSLLDVALRALDEKQVTHPSIVDLAAREVLDFPLGLGSLGRALGAERARARLEGASRALLTDSVIDRVGRYATDGRSLYL